MYFIPVKLVLLFAVVCALRLETSIAEDLEIKIEDLFLKVGETSILKKDRAEILEVSSKGVIDVLDGEHGDWILTALKPGFLLLTAKDENGILLKRWRVKVSALMRPGHATLGVTLPTLCSRTAITCNEKDKFVEGVTDDLAGWLEVIEFAKKRSWVFRLKLEANTEAMLVAKISELLSIQLSYRGTGVFATKDFCLDQTSRLANLERVNSMLERSQPGLVVVGDCMNGIEKIFYFKTGVLLSSEDFIEQIGLGGSISDLDVSGFSFSTLQAKLHSMDGAKVISVLAEPEIAVRNNQELELASGGEFKTNFHRNDTEKLLEEGWKRYGLKLKVRVYQVSEHKVQVKLKMQLSIPSSGGYESLQSHEFSTDVILPLERAFIVGRNYLNSNQNAEQSGFAPKRLPILGPLFRNYSREGAKSVLTQWVEVQEWRPQPK